MNRIVIVGAGLAGLRSAESLRAGGHNGELIVVGSESSRPYNRPPLTKELLAGKVDAADVMLPTSVNAEWRLGDAAISLDTDSRELALSSGDRLTYDGLVLASGLSAFSPWPAAPEGVHQLRTIEDAHAFRVAAYSARQIVVVGGGVLGSEAAATLSSSSAKVTLLEREKQLASPLGADVGAYLSRLHAAAGVRVLVDVDIAGPVGDPRVQGVELSDGSVLPADLVLVAVGGRPQVSWLAGSGIEHDPRRGVLVDQCLRVPGRSDIVAAGDVLEFDAGMLGRRRLENWNHAVESAQTAAGSLLASSGGGVPYRPVPSMWSDHYGRRIQVIGFLDLASSMKQVLDDAEKEQWLLEGYDEAGRLVAAVGANAPRQMLRRQALLAGSLWPSPE